MITGWLSMGSSSRTRAGCPWRDLPERFGIFQTVYTGTAAGRGDATWEKILDQLRAGCDEGRGQDVDSGGGCDGRPGASARGAPGTRPPADVDPARPAPAALSSPVRTGAEPNDKDREALGRSRGRLTSKVHLLADSGCRPLARVTSAGHRHDSLAFAPLMDRLRSRGGAGAAAPDQAGPGAG